MIRAALIAAILATSPAQADLMSVMSRYDGMHERVNRASLRKVLGIDPVRTPWCGAMLTVVVRKAGKRPPAGSFKAASWKRYGAPAARSAANVGKAIAVVRGGRHVGVYVGTDKRGRTCVKAGNTSNRVKTACYSGKSWVRK